MSISLRYYLIDDAGTIWNVPATKMNALSDGAATLPQFASQRLRGAEIVIELDNRLPKRVLRENYTYWPIEHDGHLNISLMMRQSVSAMAAMREKAQPTDGRVVEASSRFAQRGTKWTPEASLRKQLLDAALGKSKVAKC